MKRRISGFTLVELMIVVGIVAILASIALPAYNDYIRRGRIAKAVSNLSSQQLKMEQFFQDNRTYVGACAANTVAPKPTDSDDWAYTCPTLTASTYTVVASGQASMQGFLYNTNEKGTHATVGLPSGWSGASSASTCWVLKKDGTC